MRSTARGGGRGAPPVFLGRLKMEPMLDLSIVIPTYRRPRGLAACLAALPAAARMPHEVILVDAGGCTETVAVIEQARRSLGERVVVIRETRPEGFVRAINRGFRAARGRHLTWLNDDCRPLPRSLDRALDQLVRAPRHVGMTALFHSSKTDRNIAFEACHLGRMFRVLHVRGTLYANFGLASRALFERLGFFDERYRFCGADPDFSLKCWNTGLAVVPAIGALIDHDETPDDRREADREQVQRDNALLFERWDLPDRNPAINDFDQTRPCTLRGLRISHAA